MDQMATEVSEKRAKFPWSGEHTGSTDPAVQAWELISDLIGASRGNFIATVQEFDLSPPQWFVLQELSEPTPMGRLAQFLRCDNSNITGIVDRLEQRGLVARTAAERDRRVKLLVLTPAGKRLRAQIRRRLAVPPESIAGLSRSDQRALRDILRRALAE
jgi:MarR family transcriptional regulator, organic hydroperoxide resistance regulator